MLFYEQFLHNKRSLPACKYKRMNGDSGSMHCSEIKGSPYFRDIQHAIKLINISKLEKVRKWSDVNSSTQETRRKPWQVTEGASFYMDHGLFRFSYVFNKRRKGVKNGIISKNISKLDMLRQWSNINSSTQATHRKPWLITDGTSYYMDHGWLHDFVRKLYHREKGDGQNMQTTPAKVLKYIGSNFTDVKLLESFFFVRKDSWIMNDQNVRM